MNDNQRQNEQTSAAYAVVQDIPSSWERYLQLTALSVDAHAQGLLLHLAGPTDEGYRTIDVWESENAWRAAQPTGPVVAGRLSPTVRRLQAARLVVGSELAHFHDSSTTARR